jgi:membrane protein DedA with SNARE-associated domain
MEAMQHLLSIYGYFAVAGLIALESLGLPLPGETLLIGASAYAAARHGLNIWGVVAAATAGAIIGSVVAFWLGKKFGYAVLSRYGRYVWITERRIKVAEYLFRRHGGKIVFFGRFVVLFRSLAGLLAGAERMDWRRFLLFNILGALVWASVYGFCTFFFAEEVRTLAAPVSITLGVAAAIVVIGGLIWAKRHEAELEKRAASARS